MKGSKKKFQMCSQKYIKSRHSRSRSHLKPATDKMFAQRQNKMRGILSTLLLVMATSGQSEQITTAPNVTVASSTATNDDWNGSMIPGVHRACDKENETYCWNKGLCVLTQDSNVPSCICPPKYMGPRCIFSVDLLLKYNPVLDWIIAVSVATVIFAIIVIIFAYCVHKRLRKDTHKQLPETPV